MRKEGVHVVRDIPMTKLVVRIVNMLLVQPSLKKTKLVSGMPDPVTNTMLGRPKNFGLPKKSFGHPKLFRRPKILFIVNLPFVKPASKQNQFSLRNP